MESSVDVGSYTTMPRRRRDRLPTAEELQEMSLERRLATLNISQSTVPVPPPRNRRMHKQPHSLPANATVSSSKSPELYGEKSYSFDGDTRYIASSDNLQHGGYDYNEYKSSSHQSYHKYEVPRKECVRDSDSKRYADAPPLCDIIQSSQQTHTPMLRRPDILRGSFNADLRSMLADTSGTISQQQTSSKGHDKGRSIQRPNHFEDNQNITLHSSNHPGDKAGKQSRSKYTSQTGSSSNGSKKLGQTVGKSPSPTATSTPKTDQSTNNRFMFYRPKVDRLHKQHRSAIGLVGMGEVDSKGRGLMSSREGSFVNPAFENVDIPVKPEVAARFSTARPGAPARLNMTKSDSPEKLSRVKPVPTSSKPVYSTMGSSFSTRPCTPSPPSHRFRNNKPPLPSSPEPKISPIHPAGPTPLKPMLSAKQVETSLKHYPSQSRLDTTDMCSTKALENMMKYYNMDSNSSSDSPPPAKLSSKKKNQSPYSSTGSLNVSGDSIDVVLRRKKKVKIRPLSFSSDDESVKRVSLEINLAPTSDQSCTDPAATGNSRGYQNRKSLSMSHTSLNQATTEKLDLDDLTSTETAKLLKKQFAKLKVKATSLKVKDTELKQRFALLQNQRGRVCGQSGGITKSKLRSSPILL